MGIIVLLTTIFLIGLIVSDILYSKNGNVEIFNIVLFAFVLDLILVIITIGGQDRGITNSRYMKVLGAKTYIETTDPTVQDFNIMADAYEILKDYQTIRDQIEKNHTRFWDGIFYDYDDLQTYPEVQLDENILNKFK